MSKIKIIIIAFFVPIVFTVVFLYTTNWWYEYQITPESIIGRWRCSRVQWSEGITIHAGSCKFYVKANKLPYITFSDNNVVSISLDGNQTIPGEYIFIPQKDPSEGIIEISMNETLQLIDEFYLRDGRYTIKMSHSNEITIYTEDNPREYTIVFERTAPKYDLSVLADIFDW